MSRERVIYQDWIVQLGRDPSQKYPMTGNSVLPYNRDIITTVNQVINSLDQDEAAFLRFFYFQGMGYRSISRITGRAIYRLEALHQCAVRKLKNKLYYLLSDRYDLPLQTPRYCPICSHSGIQQINKIILSKKESETWSRVIRILRDRFDLTIPTPQLLIGHKKYHINEGE